MQEANVGIRSGWPGVLILAGFCLVLFWGPLVGGKVLFDVDFRYLQYPIRAFFAEHLRQGELPLWWPHIRMGFPVHAYGEGGLFYPFGTPLLLLFSTARACTVILAVHFFLSALFSYLYGRAIRLSSASSLVSAVAFSFSGHLLHHMGWINSI